jgi:peptide/nickel transport system substrate-binding protein
MSREVRTWGIGLLIVMTALTACAGPSAPGVAPNQAAPAAQAPSAPKVLRMGLQKEPGDFADPGSTGPMQAVWLAHDDLTYWNEQSEVVARLATEVPSIASRTWVVYPDGSMDVTWRLRTDVKWHDGHPLTADDYLLTWDYIRSPGSTQRAAQWLAAADQITASDPYTLVVHFPRTYAQANIGHATGSPLFQPIPRHILGDLLDRGEIEAFKKSEHWTDEFIGVGPYRLVKWERGSYMEFARFNDYFLGRPPLDRVILNFYTDLNAMMSAILAGELDLCTNCKFSVEQATELQRRWGVNGNAVLIGPSDKMAFIESQSRSELAVTPRALLDPQVRQALYRAIDRASVAEAIGPGVIEPADSWIPAQDPRRQVPAFSQSIIQYPLDPQRAERELQALGWRRGGDGILVNAEGDRFEFELRTFPDAYAERLLAVTGDHLKSIGIATRHKISTPQEMVNNEYRSQFLGMQFGDNSTGKEGTLEINRLRSSTVGSAATRFVGSNRGGYHTPQMDAAYARLDVTIPDDQRTLIQAEILRLGLTDLPLMPMFWGYLSHVTAAKVRNVPKPTSLMGDPRNQSEWDLAS